MNDELLTKIEKHLKSIAGWVQFFGLLTLLGIVIGGCNVILGVF
jgi:hypothetical protein